MSTNRPWYKRYPADFIQGTMGLSLEEKGAYSIILDLIYAKGAPIVDDERYIAGVCNISLRKWAAIRERLVEAKKITISAGFISNFRAEKEIENVSKLERKLAESGAKGGRKQAENAHRFNKNNNLDQATLKHTRAKDIETDTDIKKDTNVSQKKGCRLPDDFQPDFSFATNEGFSEAEAQTLFESFKDYWTAKTGKDATKRDWQATWRNWVRSPYNRKLRGFNHAGTNTDSRSTGQKVADAMRRLAPRFDAYQAERAHERGLTVEVQGRYETHPFPDGYDQTDDRGGKTITLVASNSR
ncbi:YdaU family protein [Bartonella apis]|uniref:YdaU family protein n=1 Tax=Bartonella apis TaxID=1686310 RepID=UPI00242FBC4B|nr:YdaU family protein [Bartonella apis]